MTSTALTNIASLTFAPQEAAKDMKSYASGKESQEDKGLVSKKSKGSKSQPAKKAPQHNPEKEDNESSGHSNVPQPQQDADGEGEEEEEQEEDPEFPTGGTDEEDGDLWRGPFKAAPSEPASTQRTEGHPRWQGLPNKTKRLQKRIEPELLGSLPVSLSRPAAVVSTYYLTYMETHVCQERPALLRADPGL